MPYAAISLIRSAISLQSKRIAEHRVAAALLRGEPEPLDRLVAAVAEQLGILLHLAAKNRAQACAEIREDVARPHDQAENFAQHLDDFVAGQIVGGDDDYLSEKIFAFHRATIATGPASSNAQIQPISPILRDLFRL